jgi:hypothetical protein
LLLFIFRLTVFKPICMAAFAIASASFTSVL